MVRLGVAVSCLAACHAATPPLASSPPAPPAAAGPTPASTISALPDLTARERSLIPELERDVAALHALGARHAAEGWQLASAADWLVDQFEGEGLGYERLGYAPTPDLIVQNLRVDLGRPGLEASGRWVVFAARYDSGLGPAQQASAAPVAALLALARAWHLTPLPVRVSLLFLADADAGELHVPGACMWSKDWKDLVPPQVFLFGGDGSSSAAAVPRQAWLRGTEHDQAWGDWWAGQVGPSLPFQFAPFRTSEVGAASTCLHDAGATAVVLGAESWARGDGSVDFASLARITAGLQLAAASLP